MSQKNFVSFGDAETLMTELASDIADKVDKVTGKGLSENDYTDADKAIVDGVTSALAGKADASSVPTKTSDITNDSGFITNLVNNLLNYYLKTETYSKTEVDALLQAITTLDIQAVNTLPTTNISTTTIYLVPKQDPQVPDVKDEYINLDGTTSGWELIGNTQIDLSNYVTTSDLTTALADYVTSEQFSKEFFIGTQAVWNSLTVSQKTEHTFAVITDDYDDNPVGNLNALTTTDKSSCVGAINEVNGKTSATHEAVVPSSDFYVDDWYIDRIGDLRLLTIPTIKDLASGYNTPVQLSSSDKPCRDFFVRTGDITTGDITIRVRQDRYVDVITNNAISGTSYLFVVIPFTV